MSPTTSERNVNRSVMARFVWLCAYYSLLNTGWWATRYDTWAVPKIVTKEVPGLRLKNSYDFDPTRYPGYRHRRTLGYAEGLSVEGNDEIMKEGSKTYVFAHRPVDHLSAEPRTAKPRPAERD